MPILVLILLISVFLYLWLARRGATLTRQCRWRQDRPSGPDRWRCAACGAETEVPQGRTPKHCLNPKRESR